jgi:ligand-binding sensor domain-containing protein/signal transduction histidine kinase
MKPSIEIVGNRRLFGFAFLAFVLLAWTCPCRAVLLWADLGATQVHDNGPGIDILEGFLQRNDSSKDTLYFKFHVDPLSGATTEPYSAAFQLFEGKQERLAIGNALDAWAYGAFNTGETGTSNQMGDDLYGIDLNSAAPDPSGIGTFFKYELVHSGIERTIVFKVQFQPGGDDLITVWMNPDLRPGATEAGQPDSLTTHFKARASFDQIHLRHSGGGDGWVFSEMAVATSFSDFINANGQGVGGETPFTFRSWQREQGLPENYVRALAQISDGYLWVGTDEGVSRFDGVNFFSLGPQEGFQGGPVEVLFGDSRGALWIGSAAGGLSCWQAGHLQRFTVRDGLPSDSITALAEDHEGRIWVGTKSGLAACQNGRLVPLNGSEIFSGKRVTTLFCDPQGAMWVGVTGVGIFCGRDGRFSAWKDPQMDSLLRDPHCLLVDQKGRIWIGAGDSFVLCKDGDQWRRFAIPRRFATHYISALAEGPDETVWAGSVGEGLFEFKDGKLVVVNAGGGLSDNLIEALLVDQQGKLWVGTHGGLNLLCPNKVTVLSHNDGLDYGAVQGVAEIKSGIAWAVQPDGIYQWEGRTFRKLLLSQLSAQEPSVNTLLAARDNTCWVAGIHGLLHFKNPLAAEEDGAVPAMTNLNITALAEDSTGGIWAGTRDGALWHLAAGKWLALSHCPRPHPVTAVVPGSGGDLWVGTEGDGLYRISGNGYDLCQKVGGLPGDWVRTLYLDSQGVLWIGTDGDGLSRLNDGQIATFTTREGLPDNTISQILEDEGGNLWLGGDRGIFRIKKGDLDRLASHKIPAVYPLTYGFADGMLSEECASGFFPNGLKTAAGMLWFPTLKGIVVVDPGRTASSPAPTVALEEVLVDGVPEVPVSIPSDIKSMAGPQSAGAVTDYLQLTPGRHTLEIRYTGFSFDAPERVRFRYRLGGLDSSWVEAGTRRVAFYSFVPPGVYHFQVVACNGDGVWNEKGAGLALKALPHFWQTWWFIGSGISLVCVIGAGSVRLVEKRRLRQRLKQLEQERALERERTRIAQDLHDLMGAKLCRISFLSEHARRSEAVPMEFQKEMRSISDDSREVLQSLDEIVWAVNPQKDSLEHLVSYIGQYARDYFRRTDIECDLEVPAQLPDQPLSSQARHHIFLAVQEALANILKHSGGTRARIAIACRNGDFEIIISDNGVGFDPVADESNSADSAAGFCNGLRNMRQRLAELNGRFFLESHRGRGTTIRFVLSLNGSMR